MTPKSFSNLNFGVLIVFCFVQYGSQTIQDGCPSITVKRNHILRTKYSIRMGAKYIRTLAVKQAHECYKACCDVSSCNLALYQYRNNSHGGIKRTCYLFDCGNPSKCSYAPLEHHAAIVFKRGGLVGGKNHFANFIPETTTTEPTTKSLAQELNCPSDVPVAMCLKNPCIGAVCSAYPSATCKPNLCGGCFAHFYDELDNRVSCKVVKATKPPKSQEEEDLSLVRKYKQSFQHHDKKPASTSSGSFKNELHKMQSLIREPIGHANKKQNLYDIDDSSSTKSSQSTKEKESIERKLEEISPHKEKPAEEEEELEHEQRVWPDNNPNYPNPPHKKTDEPLDHEQRQWPDNNPNFSGLTPHKYVKVTTKSTTKALTKPTIKSTTKPTTKALTKPTIKSTTKPTTVPAPKLIPKIVPKPALKQTAQPVVIIDKGKNSGPQRMNVTMVIEDNRVHFVENKAVLPLAIFLVIAILLLFVVALRLRIIKSKLKRRPFATEDADYLINGMYL